MHKTVAFLVSFAFLNSWVALAASSVHQPISSLSCCSKTPTPEEKTFIRVISTERPLEVYFKGYSSASAYHDYCEGYADAGTVVTFGVNDFLYESGLAPDKERDAFDIQQMNNLYYKWKPAFDYRWQGGRIVLARLKDHCLRISEDQGESWYWLVANVSTDDGGAPLKHASKKHKPEWIVCSSPETAANYVARFGIGKVLIRDVVDDLKPLSKLPITHLVLIGGEVNDFSPLADMPRLEHLTFRDIQMQSGTKLNNLQKLKTLNLSGIAAEAQLTVSEMPCLRDIEIKGNEQKCAMPFFSNTPEVRSLSLKNGIYAELGSVKNLSKLQKITANNVILHGWSDPQKVPSVQELSFANCILPGLGFLKTFPGVRILKLSMAQDYSVYPMMSRSAWQQKMDRAAASSMPNYRDLDVLGVLGNLNQLKLENFPELRDIRALSNLKKLHHLTISSCKSLNDLSPLTDLKQLKSLDLSLCESVTDLSVVESLHGLERLSLNHDTQVVWPVLGKLDRLRAVDICSDSITTAECLRGLNRLEELSLEYCYNLDDISALQGMSSLVTLKFFNNEKLTDISPLAMLVNLEELSLLSCEGVTDLSALANLKKLTELNLNNTKVANLKPLRNLTSLKRLYLCENDSVSDLTPLAGLVGLKILWLSENANVTSIQPIGRLADLEQLEVNALYGVNDLSPLGSLINLKSLEYHCQKKGMDFSFLSRLEKLEELEFSADKETLDPALLLQLKNLLYLEMFGVEAGDEYFAAIREGLPDCVIRH